MDIELDILKVLIDNQEKVIKKNGWDSHKIYRRVEKYSKEDVKIALSSLVDKKLVKATVVRFNNVSDYIYRVNDKGIDFYNKEGDNMEKKNKIEKMVKEDLDKLDIIDTMDEKQKKDYYIELTSKYPSMIKGFGNSLYGYNKSLDFYYDTISVGEMDTNFKRIKAMLEVFKVNDYKVIEEKNSSQTIYNNTMTSTNNNNNNNTNTNNNDINMTFNSVRENIEKMDNLTDDELNEIISKIDGIEEIIKSNDTKRSKWNKLKPFLIWVADKGADVAISLLPLFLQFK